MDIDDDGKTFLSYKLKRYEKQSEARIFLDTNVKK